MNKCSGLVFACLAVVAAFGASAAFEVPKGLKLLQDGTLTSGGIRAGVRLVPAPGWKESWRNGSLEDVRGMADGASQVISATWPGAKGSAVTQRLTRLGSDALKVEFTSEFAGEMKLTSAFFEIRFPETLLGFEKDGAAFALPEKPDKAGLFRGTLKSLSLVTLAGDRLTVFPADGDSFRGGIEDSRVFREGRIDLRLPLACTTTDGKTVVKGAFAVRLAQTGEDIASHYRWTPGVPRFKSYAFKAGDEWVASDYRRVTVPGSALDFSFLQDAPAGKYGFWRKGADGHGTFENLPGSRPRFFGGNFAWDSTLLEKDETDRVAAELVRLGYNWVRAHQCDTKFLPKGATDSAAIDPAILDRWDYFVYRMKASGIYFTTDCYSSRVFLPGEPELGAYAGEQRIMKSLLPFSRAAMENWKRFTRTLVCHVNPYTGLALKDEPACILLNLVNEENYEGCGKWTDRTRPLFAKAYEAWCAARGLAVGPLDAYDRQCRAFLDEVQARVLDEQLAFLRDELKVKCPLTSLNHCSGADLVVRRGPFDVADLHMYWSHPASVGKVRCFSTVYESALASGNAGGQWRQQFFSRIWGKPAVTTETRFCWPNVFRSEAGPLVGAYAAFQDWDGVLGYGYAEGASDFRGRCWIGNPFDTANDPVSIANDRISILLYRRGDVKPAQTRVCVTVPQDVVARKSLPLEFPKPLTELGLLHATGSTAADAPSQGMLSIPLSATADEAALPADLRAAKAKERYESDTKEIVLDAKAGTLSVSTPRSETRSLSRGGLDGRFLRVLSVQGPSTVSVHALDGKPLERCGRAVMFHVTDSANDGETFEDATMKYLVAHGKGPVLIRRAVSRIRLPDGFAVTALHADGSPAGAVAPDADGAYSLDTGAFPGGVMAYEVLHKSQGEAR